MKLPKYDNPPVVETVLGVQFPELRGFCAAHFGRYWERIADRYPRVTDQGRLPPVSEVFPRRIGPSVAQLQMTEGPLPQRVWYASEHHTELIQVQPDRFLYNWREVQGSPYPSYGNNVAKFESEYESFLKFCKEQELDTPLPNLCEVSYVNHIKPEPNESAIELFAKVFTGLEWACSDTFLHQPESALFNRVYVIDNDRGRLYAEASIASRVNNSSPDEFVRLKLTGRVNHAIAEARSVSDTLQVAHDWVVCGFASLTDLSIQKDRWRRSE